MQHIGDITKISGYTAPIVDCVIGGSPCQGLSLAGLRKGLDDERSGLFIEQIRVIKEMRERDKANGRTGIDVRPRYMVWENVPGAFSSNGGEDFRVVLEELARIGEPGVTIPRPPKGKWQTSGVIIGDGYSIAWRIMDAQHYGVPQRRRRIVLVADFGGHSAPRVVFGDGQHLRGSVGVDSEQAARHSGGGRGQEVSSVGDRLRGDTPPCGEKRQGAPAHAEGSPGADDREGEGFDGYNGDLTGDKSATLGVNCGLSTGRNGVIERRVGGVDAVSFNWQAAAGAGLCVETERVNPLGCTRVPAVALEPSIAAREGGHIYEGVSGTIRANAGDNQMSVAYGFDPGASRDVGVLFIEECAKTLTIGTCPGHHDGVVIALDRASFNQGENAQYDFEITDSGVNSTIVAKGPSAVAYGIGNGQADNTGLHEIPGALNCMHDQQAVLLGIPPHYIVRRLTPTECERLQGYPDGWTNIGDWVDSKGKKHKAADSPRYKALGNSIALPVWKIILKRLCAFYERDATMASLFDGIGGFPYLWEQINGNGSCLWASEIEEFPMVVTRERINKEE